MASGFAVYAVNRSAFDIGLMALLGIVGYALRKGGFPLAPVVLGFVLGGLMEKSLRRAMAVRGGGWEILFSSRLAVAIWACATLSRRFVVAPAGSHIIRALARRQETCDHA